MLDTAFCWNKTTVCHHKLSFEDDYIESEKPTGQNNTKGNRSLFTDHMFQYMEEGNMYCSNCGKENKDDANFCYACGAPLKPVRNAGGTNHYTDGAPFRNFNTTVHKNVHMIDKSINSINKEALMNMESSLDQRIKNSKFGQSPVVSMYLSKTKDSGIISTIIVLIGALLLFLSAFVPVVRLSFWGMSESFNYFTMSRAGEELGIDSSGGYAFFGILYIILAFALVFVKIRNKKVAGAALSIIALLLSIIILADFGSGVSESWGVASLGAGLFLSLFGAIITVVGNILRI